MDWFLYDNGLGHKSWAARAIITFEPTQSNILQINLVFFHNFKHLLANWIWKHSFVPREK